MVTPTFTLTDYILSTTALQPGAETVDKVVNKT